METKFSVLKRVFKRLCDGIRARGKPREPTAGCFSVFTCSLLLSAASLDESVRIEFSLIKRTARIPPLNTRWNRESGRGSSLDRQFHFRDQESFLVTFDPTFYFALRCSVIARHFPRENIFAKVLQSLTFRKVISRSKLLGEDTPPRDFRTPDFPNHA